MISAEHIRNIFDRFYKIDMHHAGSGIGLALVKAFVELHKGTITVESDEKQGTIFTVDLPVQTCETVVSENSPAFSVPATSVTSTDAATSAVAGAPVTPATSGYSGSSSLNDALTYEEEELEKSY